MSTNRSAMSLIEIMIGVILLALIVVPSLRVLIGQTKTVTATRDHSSAAFVAQKVQELCRSFKFDMIEADQYSADTDKQKKTFEWKLQKDDDYKKHVVNGIVYNIVNSRIDPIKGVHDEPNTMPIAVAFRFAIEYTGKDQREHCLEISTVITRRE